jgi:hypothetical protein
VRIIHSQNELNKTVAAVTTALWAVVFGVKSSAEVDRPQAGGYNIYEIALALNPLAAETGSLCCDQCERLDGQGREKFPWLLNLQNRTRQMGNEKTCIWRRSNSGVGGDFASS